MFIVGWPNPVVVGGHVSVFMAQDKAPVLEPPPSGFVGAFVVCVVVVVVLLVCYRCSGQQTIEQQTANDRQHTTTKNTKQQHTTNDWFSFVGFLVVC